MSQSQDFDDDDEFPVLTDVVQKGDANLIKAARQAFEARGRANDPEPDHAPLTPAEISRSITAPDPTSYHSTSRLARSEARPPLSEMQLEQIIDEIVKRHSEQLRNELFDILKRLD